MNVAESSTSMATPTKGRILYVITKATWGGAQKYVYDLATASQDNGYEVVVAYGTPGELSERLNEKGIRILPLLGLTRDIKFSSELSAFTSLLKVLKAEHPDIVHINSSKAGIFGTIAARLTGIPNIVFTAHGWAFNESRPWWQKVFFRIVHAFTILLSHYTICVSENIRKDMLWLPGISKKVIVIHNGVREPIYKTRTGVRESLWPGHTDGKIWVGMLSELHPTKRIEDAINALKILRLSHPEAILIVLGAGQQRDYLEKCIREEHLEDSVYLAGFVEDGASYLHAFDLFLHTSRTEALGYAVIEAGFATLPVVATRVGGIPEIVTDGVTGILVPPLQPTNTAEALSRYLENPQEAARMAAALHAYVVEQFSIQQMVNKTWRLYQKT